MLRISIRPVDAQGVTLRLEGQIIGPWVDELAKACEQFLREGRALTLDLTELTFADDAGVALLMNLERRNALVIGSSPFMTEQLKQPRQPAV